MKIFITSLIEGIGILIAYLNSEKTEPQLIILIIGFIVIIGSISFIVLFDKLQKFSKAVILNVHSQGALNQKIFDKFEDIEIEYKKELSGIEKHNPFTDEELDYLFEFDKNNPFKKK